MQPLGTPCWIDIQTDVPRARDFYGAVMGWSFKPVVGATGWFMAMDGRDHVAAIGPGEPRDWLVYLHVDDIEAATQACVANGGTLAVPPGEVGKLGKAAILDDPGGAPVALWQPGTHSGFTITGNPGTPVWFEVNSHDGKAVSGFFSKAMGLESAPMRGPMTYFTLNADERPRYGVMQMQDARSAEPAAWAVYFQAPDVDAKAKQVKALGGQVVAGPFDSPFGRIAVCLDPMGGRFLLIRSAGA
jgi:predicted enzyme related to lactoylglutathione lyase